MSSAALERLSMRGSHCAASARFIPGCDSSRQAHLAQHPAVSTVYYPGLASHPTHAIAARQQKGFGAMLSFELAGGVKAVRRFMEEVRFFTLAESLGGVESLVSHPTTMTHLDMGEAARAEAGITDSLLRLSIGLEAEQDLVEGLDRGLAACLAG
jgi:cystathionine gamma-synthase